MRALLVCSESPDARFTGVGKRSLQIASLLRPRYEITLAMSDAERCSLRMDMEIISTRNPHFSKEIQSFDLVYSNAQTFPTIPGIRSFDGVRLVDLYIPFFLEHQIMFESREPSERMERAWIDRALLSESLQMGDLFLCACPHQVHLYHGQLSLLRPLNTPGVLELPYVLYPRIRTYSQNPQHLCWIGGFWNWFHVSPLLQVLPALMENTQLQVSFIGPVHPFDSSLHRQEELEELESIQRDYPERIRIIPWLPPDDYLDFLKTVDVAIVLHRETTEAPYSLRTRFCEILELGIPLICSAGGFFSDLVANYQVGVVLAKNSAEELLDAIHKSTSTQPDSWGNHVGIYARFSFSKIQTKLIRALQDPLPQSVPRNPYLDLSVSSFAYERFRIKEAWRRGWRYFLEKLTRWIKVRVLRLKPSKLTLKRTWPQ